MPRTRLTDNSVLQLTLGVHLALLVLLAGWHRFWLGESIYGIDVYGSLPQAVFGGVFLALIACWSAFSTHHSALRTGAIVLLVPILTAIQSEVFCSSYFFIWWGGANADPVIRCAIWVGEMLVFAGGIAGVGLVLRCAGWRIELPRVGATDKSAWRFHLIDLVYWGILVGVFFAANRWLQEIGWTWEISRLSLQWALSENVWPQLEVMALTLLLATVVLSIKSRRWLAAGLVLLPLTLSTLEPIRAQCGLDFDPPFAKEFYAILPWYFHVLLSCVFAATFGGTLLVVRDRGYRLCWRRPFSSPPVAESP